MLEFEPFPNYHIKPKSDNAVRTMHRAIACDWADLCEKRTNFLVFKPKFQLYLFVKHDSNLGSSHFIPVLHNTGFHHHHEVKKAT